MIGTTSEVAFLDSIGICDAFAVTYHVPKLKTEDARKVNYHLHYHVFLHEPVLSFCSIKSSCYVHNEHLNVNRYVKTMKDCTIMADRTTS